MKPVCLVLALLLLPTDLRGQDPQGLVQAPNTWVKRSPVPGGPRNPLGDRGTSVHNWMFARHG